MKQIFRFAAVAMLTAISSSTALAGNWVVPAPKGQPLTVGDTVYVYNVGQKAWINKGESWGTQAVVNANAGLKYVVKQKMEENSGAVALTEGRYYLWSDCGGNKHYLKRIADAKTGTDNKACFVDGANDSGNQLQWEIADLGGNVYSIRRPAVFEDGESIDGGLTWEFVDGEYLGVNLSHDRLWDSKTWEEAGYTELPKTYALWFDVQMGDDAKWIFVSPADYAAYANKFALKTALEKAEADGVTDLSAEEAVFNKADATSEEIDNAIKSLNEKIASLVSPENPVDYTSSIVNPKFDDGINGWTSTTKAQNNTTATNVCNDPAANPEGAFDGKFYENWNPSPYTGKMYQVVKNLPNGVYKCSLAAYTQQFDIKNDVNQKQYVYFNDTKIPLTTGDAKEYSCVIDVTDNTIEMGLAQDSTISVWMGIDNAKLLFFGSGLVSYQYITKDLASILDEYEAAGETIGTAYAQAVKDIVAEAEAATTKDQALDIYARARVIVDSLKANVQAYKDLAQLYTDCGKWAYEDDRGNSSVAEDALPVIEEMQGNLDLTTGEINKYIAEIKAGVEQEFKNMALPGDDVTNTLITNPAFTKNTADPDGDANAAQDFTGWTIKGAAPGAGGSVDKRLCEVYQGDFEIYQDLTNIQNGAYQLEIQAFMRPGSAETSYSNWEAGNKETPAFIYAGDNKVMVKSICDFMIESAEAPTTSDSWSNVGGTYWIPNTMKTAYEAMAMEPANYNNVVKTLCIDGNMRIGIGANDPNATGSRWMLFHDFKLTYLGYDPSVIAPVLQELIEAANATIEAGQMASAEKTAIDDAIAAAKAAIENQDGDAMMKAYRALAKANDKAAVSVEAYAELAAALENLQNEIVNNEATASPEAAEKAQKLFESTEEAINTGAIATADCGAKITEINLAINALKIQDGSDDKPAPFTWAIKNPDFADGTKNWTLVNKGTNPGVQYQVMEGYNGNFDVYQDIENLPEGTYVVKCQGFYRYGWPDGAAKAWQADSTAYNGRLYANRDTVGLKSIILIDGIATSASGDAWKSFVDSVSVVGEQTTYYIPDQRITANERFMQEAYPNEVYTYVDASGKLRIGFCNNNTVSGDWTTAGYFELFYLGTESSHEGSTGISDINRNEIVGSKFYTIDGRRANGLSKGINIIKSVDANGKTTVRKVIVK